VGPAGKRTVVDRGVGSPGAQADPDKGPVSSVRFGIWSEQ
jgi:hypothetical protein